MASVGRRSRDSAALAHGVDVVAADRPDRLRHAPLRRAGDRGRDVAFQRAALHPADIAAGRRRCALGKLPGQLGERRAALKLIDQADRRLADFLFLV